MSQFFFVKMCVLEEPRGCGGHGINTPRPWPPEYHLISNCRFMYFWNFQTFIWATRVQAGLKTTIDMKFREKITKRWKVIKGEWCIEKKLFMNLIKYMISLKFARCRSFTGLLNRVSCFIITTLSDFSCVIKMEADWESWELKGGSQKVERDKSEILNSHRWIRAQVQASNFSQVPPSSTLSRVQRGKNLMELFFLTQSIFTETK